MELPQSILNAFEASAKKLCATRGESWEEFQARREANLLAANKETECTIIKQMDFAAKSMLPKSTVSEEEWAERAYEFRCENPPHERERSDFEEHRTY